jgi:hypothetical protein
MPTAEEFKSDELTWRALTGKTRQERSQTYKKRIRKKMSDLFGAVE